MTRQLPLVCTTISNVHTTKGAEDYVWSLCQTTHSTSGRQIPFLRITLFAIVCAYISFMVIFALAAIYWLVLAVLSSTKSWFCGRSGRICNLVTDCDTDSKSNSSDFFTLLKDPNQNDKNQSKIIKWWNSLMMSKFDVGHQILKNVKFWWSQSIIWCYITSNIDFCIIFDSRILIVDLKNWCWTSNIDVWLQIFGTGRQIFYLQHQKMTHVQIWWATTNFDVIVVHTQYQILATKYFFNDTGNEA